MRLHAIVDDLDTVRVAAEGGATVVQLRLKGVSTDQLVSRGRPFAELCEQTGVTFVVNDDVEAARRLGADYVHLGYEDLLRLGGAPGYPFGGSAANVDQALHAERSGATYIGAGPIWETPSKTDADPPIGLDGLGLICEAVSVPVVAIGGVDMSNAARCILAGAAGVAVIRAARDASTLRRVIDEALPAR